MGQIMNIETGLLVNIPGANINLYDYLIILI
jgi:hypothetical protein